MAWPLKVHHMIWKTRAGQRQRLLLLTVMVFIGYIIEMTLYRQQALSVGSITVYIVIHTMGFVYFTLESHKIKNTSFCDIPKTTVSLRRK